MKRKYWLFGGLGLLAFGGFALSACGVTPDQNLHPDFSNVEDTDQDYFVDKLFETKYLEADLDVNIEYQSEDMTTPDLYHVTGEGVFDINSLDDIAVDVSFSLDMNDPKVQEKKLFPMINLGITYVDETVFLDVNDRAVKLQTEKFSDLLELVLLDNTNNDSSSEEESITNISNTGIRDIIENLANMEVSREGDQLKYVAKTTGDQPNLVITSDLNYKITSLSISGVRFDSFMIDVAMYTNVLESLPAPIVSPETETRTYIDLTNYFGVLRKLRTILDEERFGMNYYLELRHYNPETPNIRQYYGFTDGHLNMELDELVADLRGVINIDDPRKEKEYQTTYHAQYHDECVYLDYHLQGNGRTPYKLAYTNAGMGDMWDFLGEEFEEIFGINFFDLIFGGEGAEFPIIDIIIDGTYRELIKYGKINISDTKIEIVVDNTLLHGVGEGKVTVNLDVNKDIKDIVIDSVDINSYVVDGSLRFDSYSTVKKEEMKDGYSCIDHLDDLLRSGAKYYKSDKFNLGVNLTIVDPDNKQFTTEGSTAQFAIERKNVTEEGKEVTKTYITDGYLNLKVNDFFSHVHDLDVYGKSGTNEQVYVGYTYKTDSEATPKELKLKGDYKTIMGLISKFAGGDNPEEPQEELDILDTVTPYITQSALHTLDRVMNDGDYFAILRDETIKSIEYDGDNENSFTVVVNDVFNGLDGGEDATFIFHLSDEEDEKVLESFTISTRYKGYALTGTISLLDNSGEIPTLTPAQKDTYLSIRTILDIVNNQEVKLTDVNATVSKYFGNDAEPTPIFGIAGGIIEAKLNEKTEEDDTYVDRLNLMINGNVTFSSDPHNTHQVMVGFDKVNASIKLGDLLKVYSSRQEFIDNFLTNDSEDTPTLTPTPEPEPTPAGPEDLFLPILKMLSENDYASILDKVVSTSVTTEDDMTTLVVELENSLLKDNDETTFTISINFNGSGISSISVNNVHYAKLVVDGSMKLAAPSETFPTADVTGFTHVANVLEAFGIVSNLNNSFGVEIEIYGLNDNINGFDATLIRVEKSGDYFYLIYQTGQKATETDPIVSNDENIVRVRISSSDYEEIVSNINSLVSDKDNPIVNYVMSFFSSDSEAEENTGLDIAGLLEKGFIKSMTSDTANHTLTVVIDKEAFSLDNDATIVLTYHQETSESSYKLANIAGIVSFNGQTIKLRLNTGSFTENAPIIPQSEVEAIDAKTEAQTFGGWVNAGTINVPVTYVKEMSKETQQQLVDQISGLLENKTAGMSYSISLADMTDSTAPVVTIAGDIDFDLSKLNLQNITGDLANIKLGLTSGTITDSAGTLNTTFDIRLINGEAYLEYIRDASNEDDAFKVRYKLTKINDLRDMLYEEAKNNPTLSSFIASLFSGSNEEEKTPLSLAMSTGNYISLLNYFKGFTKDGNTLYATFDSAMFGSTGDIVIGLVIDNAKGISSIKINNLNSFNQSINATLTFDGGNKENNFNYDDNNTKLTEAETNTYVDLNYLNDLVEDVLKLFGESNQKEGLVIEGEFNGMKFKLEVNIELNKEDPSKPYKVNDGKIKGYIAIGKKTHYIEANILTNSYQTEEEYKSIKERSDALSLIQNRTVANQITIYEAYSDKSSIQSKLDTLNTIPENQRSHTILAMIAYLDGLNERTAEQGEQLVVLKTIRDQSINTSIDEEIINYQLKHDEAWFNEQIGLFDALSAVDFNTLVTNEIDYYEDKAELSEIEIEHLETLRSVKQGGLDNTITQYITIYNALHSLSTTEEGYLNLLRDNDAIDYYNTITQQKAKCEAVINHLDILKAIKEEPTNKTVNDQINIYNAELNTLNHIDEMGLANLLTEQLKTFTGHLDVLNAVPEINRGNTIKRQNAIYSAQLQTLLDIQTEVLNKKIVDLAAELSAKSAKTSEEQEQLAQLQNIISHDEAIKPVEEIATLEALKTVMSINENELNVLKSLSSTNQNKMIAVLLAAPEGLTDAQVEVLTAIQSRYANKTVGQHIATYEVLSAVAEEQENRLVILNNLSTEDQDKAIKTLIGELQAEYASSTVTDDRKTYIETVMPGLNTIKDYTDSTTVREKMVSYARLESKGTIASKLRAIRGMKDELLRDTINDRIEAYQSLSERSAVQQAALDTLLFIKNNAGSITIAQEIEYLEGLGTSRTPIQNNELNALITIDSSNHDKAISAYYNELAALEERSSDQENQLGALGYIWNEKYNVSIARQIEIYQNNISTLKEIDKLYRNNSLAEQVEIYHRLNPTASVEDTLNFMLSQQNDMVDLSINNYINNYGNIINMLNTLKDENLETTVSNRIDEVTAKLNKLVAIQSTDGNKKLGEVTTSDAELEALLTALLNEYSSKTVKDQILTYEDVLTFKEEAANEGSLVEFSYGDANNVMNEDGSIKTIGNESSTADKLYGKFTISTIGDLYGIFANLSSSENLSALMEVFSSQGESTLLNDITSGNIRAILYNKIIKNISYSVDLEDNTISYYSVTLNGDLFKAVGNGNDKDITLVIEMMEIDNKKTIKSIIAEGEYQDNDVDVKLNRVGWVGSFDTDAKKYEDEGKTQYDLSNFKELGEHIVNTADTKDFILTGGVSLNVLLFGSGTATMDAQLHMETNTYKEADKDGNVTLVEYDNYYAKVKLTDIPKIDFVSEYGHSYRHFTMYILNEVVIGEDGLVAHDKDGSVVRRSLVSMRVDQSYSSWGTQHTLEKGMTITLQEFMDNLAYYLLNYGYGVKDRIGVGNPGQYPASMKSTGVDDGYQPTYSTLLKSYEFDGTDPSIPTWNATVDIKNLLNNGILGDGALVIKGNTNNVLSYLSLTVPINIGSFEFGNAGITVNYPDKDAVMSETVLNEIIDYVNAHEGETAYDREIK